MLITECLSGRILHDFASSMQGIVGGLEELEENNPNMQNEALSLLKESSDDLIYKYKVMKQAYSHSSDNCSFVKTKSNIENYLFKKKVKLQWRVSECPTENLIEKINKIISNMVITIISAVAQIELVSILLTKTEDKTLLTIKVVNEHKSISTLLVSKLTKKNDIRLDTKDIIIYMTSLLLEQYNTKINCTCESNSLNIGLTIT
ncbi:histidine phosphotransferase family protein [Wolbachia endosymbiont of Tetranychus urticae]